MSKTRAVIVSSEFPPGPGGIGRHAFDFSRALSLKGYQVSVFANQDFSTNSEIEYFNGRLPSSIQLYRFPGKGRFSFFERWRMIRNYLVKNTPQFILLTGRSSIWMSIFIKAFFGNRFPIHVIFHGSENNRKKMFYQWITKRSIRNTDVLWAVSEFTASLMKEFVSFRRMHILPNGVWTSDWHQMKQPTKSVLTAGFPKLLTVGRISPRKGQHRVVIALPQIKMKFSNIHYHVVGIDSGKEQLLLSAISNEISCSMTIHGKMNSENLMASYQNCDIFIMLSENQDHGEVEGFGIAILEANMMGKPAIGARGCGIESAIKDGINGRLVDGNNVQEIIDAITDIMDHYEEYSERSKKWAIQHDWNSIIDKFLDYNHSFGVTDNTFVSTSRNSAVQSE